MGWGGGVQSLLRPQLGQKQPPLLTFVTKKDEKAVSPTWGRNQPKMTCFGGSFPVAFCSAQGCHALQSKLPLHLIPSPQVLCSSPGPVLSLQSSYNLNSRKLPCAEYHSPLGTGDAGLLPCRGSRGGGYPVLPYQASQVHSSAPGFCLWLWCCSYTPLRTQPCSLTVSCSPQTNPHCPRPQAYIYFCHPYSLSCGGPESEGSQSQ